MAKLTAAQRKALPSKSFAVPSKKPDSGSYPVNDKTHARAALSMVAAHGTAAEKAAVRSKVAAKYPDIKQSKGKGGKK